MAGTPGNSGGNRPDAPQNNPANISATGGNGQSGTQAPMYMPGLGYGEGGQNMANQGSATLAGNPSAAVASQSAPAAPQLPPVVGLDQPTERPDQVLTYGADSGPGPDSSILNLPAMATPQVETPIQIIQALYMLDPTNQDLRFVLEGLSNQGRL
jgi:hypothetical protein